MKLATRTIESLVASVLSVNSYPLEKSWSLLPALGKSSLTDPDFVAGADPGDVTVRLGQSGYNRGMLTGMMAERLRSLMVAVNAGTLDGLEGLVAGDKKEKALSLLRTVNGIGTAVAHNAWLLLRV